MNARDKRLEDNPPNEDARLSDPISWVDKYGDYLYNYALSRLRDSTAAEDAVQETFLAALKSHRSFAGQSTERTWLVGILRHKIVDYLRKVFRDSPPQETKYDKKASQSFSSDGPWVGHWLYDKAPVDWGKNPERFLEDKEFWKVLEHCLKELSPRMASAFTLHEMEEMPGAEICKELELTPTNLWVLLHRARRHLRQCLEINWIGDAGVRTDP